jgi:1,4-dihydroxy-2-naphthoate polyprenyltransferase
MNAYRNWFLGSRPWSFTMTAISIGVGVGLAAVDGPISWFLFFVTLLGMILIHSATNLINDYYDVLSGVDSKEVSTAQYRPHPLVRGELTPFQVKAGAFLLYLLGTSVGVYLSMERGWEILGIGLIGLLASLTYTAPPIKYKYTALGELSVFLMWGPLMVEGTYFVQRQAFSQTVLWVSLPFGALVALVLLANNLRDLVYDREKGILTLPILIGKKNGIRLYVGLICVAYLAVFCMSFLGSLPLWSLMVFLSSPLAWRLMKESLRELPDNADARTAQLNTAFGALLVMSLIGERLFL